MPQGMCWEIGLCIKNPISAVWSRASHCPSLGLCSQWRRYPFSKVTSMLIASDLEQVRSTARFEWSPHSPKPTVTCEHSFPVCMQVSDPSHWTQWMWGSCGDPLMPRCAYSELMLQSTNQTVCNAEFCRKDPSLPRDPWVHCPIPLKTAWAPLGDPQKGHSRTGASLAWSASGH